MKGNRASYVRGKRLRATRLDRSGRPVYGEGSVVVTKGFITIGMTSNVEEGEAISQTNADGDTCINEPGLPSFTGVGVEIEFCEVDFALFEMMTGQPVVLNDDGEAVGITESTSVDLSNVGFAMEMWLGADTKGATPRQGSQGDYGYILLPFVSGGVISDVSIENGAINFTVNNMATKNGSRWGSGPYNVELVGGAPKPLRTPLRARDHRRIMNVEVAPPTVYAGSIPLLDPTAAALTAVTVGGTGRNISFTVTGSGGVFYDFGDGTWDYSETGSHTHEYEADGTYQVIARRGLSEVTRTVTVPRTGS